MAISNKILVLILILTFGSLVDVNAQTRRRKIKSRRTTPIARPQTISPTLEPEVISRAEEDLNGENGTASVNNGSINPDPQKKLPTRPLKTVVAPTNKANSSAQEKEDRSLLDLERLSLAEGRAEAFRKQLSDVIEREAAMRSKIEQLDYQMRPEVIQSETATIGSLRPEEVRESRRKMLENEKTRTNEQLTQILQSRTRLEAAVINADSLVDKLRARVESEIDEETRKSANKISAKDSTEPKIQDN
ncbi:MAG: hypothetical protein ABI954_14340 [Pyrinomonadaceae bacterium]